MRAWIFQDPKQLKTHGPQRASWCVGWYEPDGARRQKSVGPGSRGKRAAELLARKIEGEMAAGTYASDRRTAFADFLTDYERLELTGKAPRTREAALGSLKIFERVTGIKWVNQINTRLIDDFVAKRRAEPGLKSTSAHPVPVAAATINRDLRHIKAALKKACKWEMLPKMPEIVMLREPLKLPRFVSPEDFLKIYAACGSARMPKKVPNNITPLSWWRALLTLAYMTGWRISELLSLRWQDIDIEAGVCLTRWDENKGKRDELTPLHACVIEHLQPIRSFEVKVLPWPHHRTTLYDEFHRIQTAAGIHVECRDKHEHTAACHFYGFHDFRRGFASMNADRMTPDALQSLMRHASYSTTQRYINLARQLKPSADKLFVPDFPKESDIEAS